MRYSFARSSRTNVNTRVYGPSSWIGLLLSVLALSMPVSAQGTRPCTCGGASTLTNRGLLVWRGSEPLTLSAIAHLVAPVLWFSPDEPLRLEGRAVPQRHPADREAGDAVVYYQARSIRLHGDSRVDTPAHQDPEFFDKVDSVAIRFYFYYERDFGVGQHAHDLEVVEMELSLNVASRCRELMVRRVTGFAHGTDWYSNELEIEADTRMPITVLVEEGKHASAPDRNADGQYTPGYDVNRRITDAWGIRDVLGSGHLVAGAYEASMAKPRKSTDRVAPPAATNRCVTSALSSLEQAGADIDRYVLRPAWSVPVGVPPGPEPERLQRMMRAHRFGSAYPPDQYQFELLKELADPLTGTTSIIPAIGARWDRRVGVSIQLRGADLRQVYVVPKINWVGHDVGVQALFTRSAARVYSPYASLGLAREHLSFNGAPTSPNWNATTELGVKFRTRVEGRQRLLSLGYQFAGVRVGIGYSGFKTVKLTRMIVEVGPGVW